LSLKDNARKFGAGGQTLTPRHTIDAILGLKNRNGQAQSCVAAQSVCKFVTIAGY